jgi:hypothetical protein
MNQESENLEYVTVDSVQWSTGHVRPRMSEEDKRAKHRAHQRRFVLRKHMLREHLRRELRCHSLQLQCLQAAEIADSLTSENESLREQLSALSTVDHENRSGITHYCRKESDHLSEEPDEVAILEILQQLPDPEPSDVTIDEPRCSDPYEEADFNPLPWSPTTPCALAIMGPATST